LDARNVLVCIGEVHREAVARSLAAVSEYQVHIAPDKTQALERMRDEWIDIIILSGDFDPAEQGAAFITREVSTMRPAERRRLFLVQLTEMGRSMDSHSAFINNVNLIVNPCDLEKLPRNLERAMRDYNELYRGFNEAMGVRAI
jgi:DNA-binding response OmpR family regulator